MSLNLCRIPRRRALHLACTIGLSGALIAGGAVPALTIAPATAHAASAQTLSELRALQSEVSGAASTYAEAMAKANELNEQVSTIADEILHIEEDLLPERQQRAASAASDLYKTHTSSGGAIGLLLNASSFADFINLTKYLGTVQDANVAALNELNQLEDELNGKLKDLSQAKDQADAELARAQAALDQAQSAAAQLQAKANAEDAEEAEIARKAAEEAQRLDEQQQEHQGGTGQAPEQGNQSGSSGDSSNQGSGSGQNNNSGTGGNQGGQNQGGSAGESAGAWKTGVASYYGIGDGFMGGTTANGEKVTETSMGIAMLNVPFGTRVEIRYGGRSVIAYVNDRGPYAHGRVIDMQPAVARALNFLSVGVGTVQYRFL